MTHKSDQRVHALEAVQLKTGPAAARYERIILSKVTPRDATVDEAVSVCDFLAWEREVSVLAHALSPTWVDKQRVSARVGLE